MRIERPIVEALTTFIKDNPTSLHVPGHKNGLLSHLPSVIKESLRYDLTELPGLDDFHHPEEAIKEAELLLAQTYGADASFFLVNGSTVGNLAMIYAVCQSNDTIIVQRNAHKSIFHAIELVGVEVLKNLFSRQNNFIYFIKMPPKYFDKKMNFIRLKELLEIDFIKERICLIIGAKEYNKNFSY